MFSVSSQKMPSHFTTLHVRVVIGSFVTAEFFSSSHIELCCHQQTYLSGSVMFLAK